MVTQSRRASAPTKRIPTTPASSRGCRRRRLPRRAGPRSRPPLRPKTPTSFITCWPTRTVTTPLPPARRSSPDWSPRPGRRASCDRADDVSRAAGAWPTAVTHLVGIIGNPIRHSLSPVLHNAAFSALDIDWAYVAFEVPAGGGTAAVQAVRALGLEGLSV